MKILFTGGHLTPALAVIDFLQEHHLDVEMVFVGRLYSQKKLKQKAVEKKEVKQRGLPFIQFEAVKLDFHGGILQLILKPFKFIISLINAYKILKEQQADIFLSFGGYMAVPFAIAAKLQKIKIITHEGTRVLSWSNNLIAKIADKVAVSFPEVKMQLKGQNNVTVTGTPLRPALSKLASKPDWFTTQADFPVLLVIGGNQGSKAINYKIGESLSVLLKKWTVVHVCGRPNRNDHYSSQLQQLAQQTLTLEQQRRYFIREWIDVEDLTWIYQHAKAAVSRAGANTVEELCLHRVPTLFIPLPHAHLNEQYQNVAVLENNQAALVLPQTDLNQSNLLENVQLLAKNNDNYRENLERVCPKNNGTAQLVDLIFSV